MNFNYKLLSVLILIINWSLIYSQGPSIEDYNLNGKVKLIRGDSYLAKMTSQGLEKVTKGWDDAEKNDEIIEFDEYGKVSKVSYLGNDSKPKSTDKYIYDGERLVKSITKYQKSKYTYNKQGRIATIKVSDRTPDVISSSNIDETDEKVKFVIKNQYDKTGKIILKTEQNSQQQLVSTTSYKYNDKGQLIKEETDYIDYKEFYIFKYDSNGNMINKKWYDSDDGLLENETNTYSGEKLISKVWENYYEGELEGKLTFKYEKGNELEIKEFDLIDKTQKNWRYSYEYDSQNNWTKKIAHTYKDEYYIIYRNIQYY